MKTVFLVALLAHVIYALATRRTERRERTWKMTVVAVALQTPAFLLACWFAVGQGAFSRDLVSPLYIALGLLTGHAVFALSLVAIDLSPRNALWHLADVQGVWDFAVNCPLVLRHVLGVSVAEEIIWRVGAQTILAAKLSGAFGRLGTAAGVVVVAIGFSVVHRHFLKNALRESVEFLAFSALLGVLYCWSQSLILVVVLHALRNLEIAYLEYQIKVEELGDPERAAQMIEEEHLPPRRRGGARVDQGARETACNTT